MDLTQETDLLRKVPMLEKLDDSKLKLLAFTSEMVNFPEGDTLFFIGDSAECAYVIMHGEVNVVTETPKGPVVVATLQANQLVGELALLNNAPRNATLVAKSDVKAMKISAEMFLKLLTENADVALHVMRQLSDKLSKSHEQVERLQEQLSQLSS